MQNITMEMFPFTNPMIWIREGMFDVPQNTCLSKANQFQEAFPVIPLRYVVLEVLANADS